MGRRSYRPAAQLDPITEVLTIVLTLAGGVAGMALMGARSSRQRRKPSSRAGEMALQRMNISHAGVTAWGLSHVEVDDAATILDVGCGGDFLIVAETYRGRRNDWLYRPVMRGLLRAAYLTPAEHRELLRSAGFVDVQEFVDAERGWVCVRGRKPPKVASV